MPEHLPRIASIHLRGLHGIPRHREQSGEQQDREYGRAHPYLGEQDREHGEIPVDQPWYRAVAETQRMQRIVQDADVVVENELELVADEDRRKHHRKHHDRPERPLAPRNPVDQQGDAQPEQEFEIESDRKEQDRAAECDPEIRVREYALVVSEAHPVVKRVGANQPIAGKARVQREQQRKQNDEEQRQDSRKQQQNRHELLALPERNGFPYSGHGLPF